MARMPRWKAEKKKRESEETPSIAKKMQKVIGNLGKCCVCGSENCQMYKAVVCGDRRTRGKGHYHGLLNLKDGDAVVRQVDKETERVVCKHGQNENGVWYAMTETGKGEVGVSIVGRARDTVLVMFKHALWSVGFEVE